MAKPFVHKNLSRHCGSEAETWPQPRYNRRLHTKNTKSEIEHSISSQKSVQRSPKLKAGGKPSTRLPPGGLVERKQLRIRTCHATSVPRNNRVASESFTVVSKAERCRTNRSMALKHCNFRRFEKLDQKCDLQPAVNRQPGYRRVDS